MGSADIKLFVSCHKSGIALPDNKLLYPIQVGAAKSKKRLSDMLHDDEGDNISVKNGFYCELTAQYWAWKNMDADYFGFMHYRRYFSFANRHFSTNYFGDVLMDVNDDRTLKRLCFDEKTIRETVEKYDFIVPEPGAFVDRQTIREQYDSSWQHQIEDLDCALEIIDERYPAFSDVAREYLGQFKGYFCNMFIMRKELFDEYSSWLFDILEEHERRRDFSDYDVTSYRVSGYLAERLCGVYLTWLQKQDYQWTTLQRVLFANVEAPAVLNPVFEHDAVQVAFSANDFYVPYLSTLLQSIADHASSDRNYDLVVLHENITSLNQRLLKKQVESDNISLRFLNVFRPMHDFQEKLPVRGHFRVETYFRLLLPQLLAGYKKILYLDADMVVLKDIAPLYDTDIEGYLVAACRDADTAGLYNGAARDKREYMDDELKIKRPYDYFQAGTILFNLDEWRKKLDPEEIFAFAMSDSWDLLDQDVLNYFCQDSTKLVDMAYNVMMDWRFIRIPRVIMRAPRSVYQEYMTARKDPAIVHFAGPDKPWDHPMSDLAWYFWEYARKSPYYEEILSRLAFTRACDAQDRRSRGLKVKEFIYRHFIAPVLHSKNAKTAERREYLYRMVNPRKPDIF